MILSSALQAIGLFIATNIDDIIVLSLFFARGAGQRGTAARILAGQYLGFVCILGVAVLVSLGAGAFLPPQAIPYFGLIPLGLGLWAAWQAWRGDDDDDDAKVEGKNVAVWTVAGVTFANGGDNIGVYVPVFLNVGPGAVVAGGLTVGADAAVGANSVVVRDVPPRGVVLGIPARLVSRAGSFAQVRYRGMDGDAERAAARKTTDGAAGAATGVARPGTGVDTEPRTVLPTVLPTGSDAVRSA